jgi:hypothetical protein
LSAGLVDSPGFFVRIAVASQMQWQRYNIPIAVHESFAEKINVFRKKSGSLAKTCVEEENQENPDLCCCAL